MESDEDYKKEHGTKQNKIRIEVIQALIGKRFNCSSTHHVHYLIDILNEIMPDIEKRLIALEKFKDHRHKSLLGLYTEKAVY